MAASPGGGGPFPARSPAMATSPGFDAVSASHLLASSPGGAPSRAGSHTSAASPGCGALSPAASNPTASSPSGGAQSPADFHAAAASPGCGASSPAGSHWAADRTSSVPNSPSLLGAPYHLSLAAVTPFHPTRRDPALATPSPVSSPLPELPEHMKADYLKWLALNPIEDSPVHDGMFTGNEEPSECNVGTGFSRSEEAISPPANTYRPPCLRELFNYFKQVVKEEEETPVLKNLESEDDNKKDADQQKKEKGVVKSDATTYDGGVCISDTETDDGVVTSTMHLGGYAQVPDE